MPESEREKRHALRTSLTRLGFGTAAPGVWVAPGNLAAETRRTLERRGLGAYVDIFAGEHLAFGDLRAKVREWWDLDELTALYADFLRRHRPVLDRVAAGTPLTPAEFRPLPADAHRVATAAVPRPGLPLSLLPADWNGVTAGALFGELDAALGSPARDHALRGHPRDRPLTPRYCGLPRMAQRMRPHDRVAGRRPSTGPATGRPGQPQLPARPGRAARRSPPPRAAAYGPAGEQRQRRVPRPGTGPPRVLPGWRAARAGTRASTASSSARVRGGSGTPRAAAMRAVSAT